MSTGKTLPLWSPLSAFNDAHFTAALPPGDADVVVVGAGVAGLSIALCCAQEGREVLVVDRQGAGEGETLRTTAHLASALDDRFYKLSQWHGKRWRARCGRKPCRGDRLDRGSVRRHT